MEEADYVSRSHVPGDVQLPRRDNVRVKVITAGGCGLDPSKGEGAGVGQGTGRASGYVTTITTTTTMMMMMMMMEKKTRRKRITT